MRNITITILLALALFAGCSISASLHGQELSPKLPANLFELKAPPARPVSAFSKFQNLKRSLMAIIRIRHKDANGQINWFGSGIVIKKTNGHLYILSNQHVCGYPNDSGSIEAEFVDASGHKSLGFFKVEVLAAIQKNNIDAAICRLPHGQTLDHIPTLPLGSDEVESSSLIVQTGCDGGNPVNQSLGYALKRSNGLIWYLPSSYSGDSGSAIISSDGLRTVGLVAWSTRLAPISGTVGLAQTVPAVVAAFKRGKTSPLPNNVFSVADQRFGFRRPPKTPQEPLDEQELDDLFGIEIAPDEDPETPSEAEGDDEYAAIGPLRNLLDRLLKGQEDLKNEQEEEKGILGGLISRMNLIQTALTWLWRLIIVVVVLGCIGLFAQQGWLLRIVVTIVKLFIRLTKAAIAVVSDAITKPLPPKDASVEDQLASIREELTEEITNERKTP